MHYMRNKICYYIYQKLTLYVIMIFAQKLLHKCRFIFLCFPPPLTGYPFDHSHVLFSGFQCEEGPHDISTSAIVTFNLRGAIEFASYAEN